LTAAFVYSGDTLLMLEFFARMRAMRGMSEFSPSGLRAHLGHYAGIALGFLRLCRSLRQGIIASHPERCAVQSMRSLFTSMSGIELPHSSPAVRGIWVQAGHEEKCLRHDNFTSFSLALEGAAYVLNFHQNYHNASCADSARAVPQQRMIPIFLVLPQHELLRLGVPTHAFYPEQPSSKGQPAGVADKEQEVVLPPFVQMHAAGPPVPSDELRSIAITKRIASAWSIDETSARSQLDMLSTTVEYAWHFGTFACYGRPDSPHQLQYLSQCTEPHGHACSICGQSKSAFNKVKEPFRWIADAQFVFLTHVEGSWESQPSHQMNAVVASAGG